MPVDPNQSFSFLTFFSNFYIILKGFFLLAFIMYFLFSLVIIRQVQLLTDIVITEISPVLRALTILHAGFALGIIVLFFGLF